MREKTDLKSYEEKIKKDLTDFIKSLLIITSKIIEIMNKFIIFNIDVNIKRKNELYE